MDELIDDTGTRVCIPPEVIRISSPKDSFEKTIADAYQHALRGLAPQI